MAGLSWIPSGGVTQQSDKGGPYCFSEEVRIHDVFFPRLPEVFLPPGILIWSCFYIPLLTDQYD